jgi:hypothetical protein
MSMARSLVAAREVSTSELSPNSAGLSVVASGGLLYVLKNSEVVLLSTVPDVSTPPFRGPALRNTSIPGSGFPIYRGVCRILTGRAFPQVRASVVEPVAVGVVGTKPGARIQYQPVHKQRPAVDFCGGVIVPTNEYAEPLMTKHTAGIGCVNQRKRTATQRHADWFAGILSLRHLETPITSREGRHAPGGSSRAGAFCVPSLYQMGGLYD